ncbi:uncharacterized protein LOC101211090 [Cucumis sativus]|nr:uncharacterized protein LOC101211090 [Cucumis sativus]XP_011651171.1 uncharacterized protein LOC101211090 [Cucumis sativus]KAE8650461.1 hypothetical protein Csa_009585 [Cucumis sativus]
MPVAKLKASNYPDVMKPEEGNDSLDTIIRQAIGKEPFLSFSRAGESPVQWIQLLHALDQQELPGWPLLSPLKIQMQKCEKCAREFCSVINYRRHIRVHHRLKKLDKDSAKSRDLLAAFWDKLTWEETKEAVSFKNVSIEGIQGSAVIKNLTAIIGKPGFSALPHVYLRAGSALLDIVQGRPSRFPLSSQELFEILDNASEKTFLCGTAVSMQKYIFDGDAVKIGLETKNLVACMSFLLEEKLVKTWLADKDAEALRCQKLLVEEEEAAQRRQAELLERKRQKKLRQKEQRSKEQKLEEKADIEGSVDEMIEDGLLEESSSPQTECHSERDSLGILPDHTPSSIETSQHSLTDEDEDSESHSGFHNGYPEHLPADHNGEQQKIQMNGHKHVISQWQALPKTQRGLSNGYRADQNYQGLKNGDMRRHGNHVQSRAAPIVNGKKVWSRKPKPERDGDRFQARIQEEATTQAEEIKSHEVLIGSISVALGNCNQESKDPVGTPDDYQDGHQTPKKINNHLEKFVKPDSIQTATNRVMVKLWRPVSRNGTKYAMPDQSENGESEAEVTTEKLEDQALLNVYSPHSLDGDTADFGNDSFIQEEPALPVGLEFSSRAAKAFLAQRWKEAITADHVKLNLPSDSESSGCFQLQNENETNFDRGVVVNNGNTILINLEAPKSSANEAAGKTTTKFRTKFEKGAKIKYIPKLRTTTTTTT